MNLFAALLEFDDGLKIMNCIAKSHMELTICGGFLTGQGREARTLIKIIFSKGVQRTEIVANTQLGSLCEPRETTNLCWQILTSLLSKAILREKNW